MTQTVCSVQLHLWNSCVGEITGQWSHGSARFGSNVRKANWHRRCERKICTRWKPSLEVQWLVGLLLAGGELNPWIPTRRLIPLLATVPHTLPGPSSASPVLCVADIRDELVNESTRPQIWVNSHPGNGLHLARPPVLCVALIFHSGTWVGR